MSQHQFVQMNFLFFGGREVFFVDSGVYVYVLTIPTCVVAYITSYLVSLSHLLPWCWEQDLGPHTSQASVISSRHLSRSICCPPPYPVYFLNTILQLLWLLFHRKKFAAILVFISVQSTSYQLGLVLNIFPLCSSDCLGTRCIIQSVLELREICLLLLSAGIKGISKAL